MPALALQALTNQEKEAMIEKLAARRTAPAVQGRRAQLLMPLAQGASPPEAAARVGGLTAQPAPNVLKGFNQGGLRVLEDSQRQGRPPILTEQDRGRLGQLAQRPPKEGRVLKEPATGYPSCRPPPRRRPDKPNPPVAGAQPGRGWLVAKVAPLALE
jgi:hypothetical protein